MVRLFCLETGSQSLLRFNVQSRDYILSLCKSFGHGDIVLFGNWVTPLFPDKFSVLCLSALSSYVTPSFCKSPSQDDLVCLEIGSHSYLCSQTLSLLRHALVMVIYITKTCLYNFDPCKHHFYVVKLGFIGVYIIFLISAQKHRLWVLVRTASLRRF